MRFKYGKHVPLLAQDDGSVHSLDYDDSSDDWTVDSRSVCSRKSCKSGSPITLTGKRFIPTPSDERSFCAQFKAMTDKQRFCIEVLRIHWETDHPPLPGVMYLRFARFHDFKPKESRKALDGFDQRLLMLTASKLEPILRTKVSKENYCKPSDTLTTVSQFAFVLPYNQTLFPVPGLKSKDGLDMFYMRPSRYFPKQTRSKFIVDNLAYVMSTMVEREETSIKGIGLLACMDDWTKENFSVSYMRQFMTMLQGGVPARVGLFLIVNPPVWFKKAWKIMKPMLAPRFRRNVSMIKESELEKYLAPGYKTFLPDDMMTGEANTKKIVDDFIADRQKLEESYFDVR